MRFDVITIFPDFFAGPLNYGIVRRARESRRIEANVHDLRSFTHDRHRTVDDRPFGGGPGMVLKPEPIFEAVESLTGADGARGAGTAVILVAAGGTGVGLETDGRVAGQEGSGLICGRDAGGEKHGDDDRVD